MQKIPTVFYNSKSHAPLIILQLYTIQKAIMCHFISFEKIMSKQCIEIYHLIRHEKNMITPPPHFRPCIILRTCVNLTRKLTFDPLSVYRRSSDFTFSPDSSKMYRCRAALQGLRPYSRSISTSCRKARLPNGKNNISIHH